MGGGGVAIGGGGLLLLVVLSLVTGQNPLALLQLIGGTQVSTETEPAGRVGAPSAELGRCAATVLASTEDVWERQFARRRGQYERGHMRAHATAQPLRTWTQPLSLQHPAREELAKLLITCSLPLAQVRQMIAAGHPWFAALAGPQWSFRELPTGHWPMFSVPDKLASLLGDLPSTRPGSAV